LYTVLFDVCGLCYHMWQALSRFVHTCCLGVMLFPFVLSCFLY
jgi:hypothetical protein